ncbi:MAG TPA: acyl-ACP--UDP-N-acetylglucosamine O-acyltransferase [Verrucomicrobiae bacterium]|nr:acyl-ACP--UDP-N-acetylglucosamine O-acyltransferase [Verrucomicrobiae bacterium]
MIHRSAIVHPKAKIGAGCEIGPFCIVGEHVALGKKCKLHSHVVIEGHTKIGEENEFFSYVSIGLKTQDLKWKGGTTWTILGDNNTIREYVGINSATGDGEVTQLGSNNHILCNCHIGHNCIIGNHVIMGGAILAGHVTVEDYARISTCAIHQFCRIGKMSMIGGCSKVVQDVPPYMLADGNPAETRTINKVAMERSGMSDESQKALRSAYKILFREGLTVSNALAKIKKELPQLPEIRHLAQFIRASERGIGK